MSENRFTHNYIISTIRCVSFASLWILTIVITLSCQAPTTPSKTPTSPAPTPTVASHPALNDQFLPANNPSDVLLVTDKERYHQKETIIYTIKNNSEQSISYYTYGLCNDLGVIRREGNTITSVTLTIIESLPELVELKPGQANTCTWNQWGYWLSPDGRDDYVSPGQYQFVLDYYPTSDLTVPAQKRTVSRIFTIFETKTVIVSLLNPGYNQIKDDIEAVYTTSSGKGVWLELTPTNFAKLQASEIRIERVVDTFFPELGQDPILGDSTLPVTLTSVYTSNLPNFYIIQLRGPLQPEWEAILRHKGVDTYVSPYYGFSYVYRITPEQVAEIQGLDFVRWVGPYHTAYRLTPTLEKLLIIGFQTISTSVVIYDDHQQSVDTTIKTIEEIGGVFHNRGNSGVAPPTETANFVVPTSAIPSIGQLQNVLLVDHWVEPYLESE